MTGCDKDLAEKAKELSAFSNSAFRYSNGVVLYAMFLLYAILQEQAADPQNNLATILSVTQQIAALSLSLRV